MKSRLLPTFDECLLKDEAAVRRKITDWMRQQKKRILHKLVHRHGAFRIHLVLHVSDVKMRVPMDEHFDIALHGFEGMR